MTAFTHDETSGTRVGAPASGLGVALLSALSFGLAGALASPLLDQGWSSGAVVLIRVVVAAVAVLPFGIMALRGRWRLLLRHARVVIGYGALAVAGAQFGFFSAVRYMEVAPALLIEYTAPAAVVGWMWLRHDERPSRLTLLGAAVAVAGLVLVIDVLSGADVSGLGVMWALFAMTGLAAYFVMSADDSHGLPPMVLASAGLVVGGLILGGLGLIGVLSMQAQMASVDYAGLTVSWWIPLVLLGVITGAVAYTTGIVAGRRLGSRMASFVGLTEVLAAVLWAWLLLDELAAPIRLFGGLLIVGGVIIVKLGERRMPDVPDVP